MRVNRVREAWELFKGALEVSRAMFLDPDLANDTTCQGFISRAKDHLSHLSDYLRDQDTTAQVFVHTVLPEEVAKKYPCLVLLPLQQQPYLLSDSMSASQCMSRVIFNMASIEHARNRFHRSTIDHYEMALYVVQNEPISDFTCALLNNMSVWLYENGYMCESQLLSKNLRLIQSSWMEASFSPDIQSNIEFILMPPNNHGQVSPAA